MAETIKKPSLLLVSGGLLQIFALQRARELGIETHLVDGSEHCAAREHADYFYKVSTKDVEAVAELAKKLAGEGKINGVYTQGTDATYTVAYAARAAGLPGIEPQAALNGNDKTTARRMLVDAGISNIAYAVVTSLEDARLQAEKIGFPLFVKAADNSGSKGVTRVVSDRELEMAFTEALKNCYGVKKVLLEKEVLGLEYSVDTILYKGVLYPAGISDRAFLPKENYAVHIGSRTPSMLSVAVQNAMYIKMDQAAKLLGVTDGAFKGDLVVREGTDEVEILEVTARLSGGHDSQLRKPLSYGIDLLKATMDIALGRPLDFKDIIPRWVKWTSTFAVFPEPGVVTAITGVDDVKNIDGVKDVVILVKVGDTVEPYISSVKRNNFITVVADSYEKLLELEKEVTRTLKIETTPA